MTQMSQQRHASLFERIYSAPQTDAKSITTQKKKN